MHLTDSGPFGKQLSSRLIRSEIAAAVFRLHLITVFVFLEFLTFCTVLIMEYR